MSHGPRTCAVRKTDLQAFAHAERFVAAAMIALGVFLPHHGNAQQQHPKEPTKEEHIAPQEQASQNIEKLPEIAGMSVYPGSDLENFLNKIMSEPADANPRDHGK